MEPLQQKLTEIIERRLDRGQADLERLPGGRIAGHVISPEFDDTDFLARRDKLNAILEEELSPDELREISILLNYTPEEWNIPLEAD